MRFPGSRYLFIFLVSQSMGCAPSVPEPGTEPYLEAIGTFYSGVAAMQIGDDLRGRARLERTVELTPTESAAWTNLAILALRRGEIEAAQAAANRALEDGSGFEKVVRVAARTRLAVGDTVAARSLIEGFAAVDRLSARTLVLLADLSGPSGSVDPAALLERAARQLPGNAALLYRLARFHASRGDNEAARTALSRLLEDPRPHPEPAILESAIRGALTAPPELQVLMTARVGNVLMRAAWYRDDLDEVASPPELVEKPIGQPNALQPMAADPAPADRDLSLSADSIAAGSTDWDWVGTVFLGVDPLPSVLMARDRTLYLPDGREVALESQVLDPAGVTLYDFDQDFRIDLAMAGAEGVDILKQTGDRSFVAVPGAVPDLPPARRLWTVDFDMEGDLDLVVALENSRTMVLLNTGDGSFVPGPDLDVRLPRDLAWGDVDGDGDPDASFVDESGALQFLENRRNGRWAAARALATGVSFVEIVDFEGDGVFDLAVIQDGRPASVSYSESTGFSVDSIPVDADRGGVGATAFVMAEMDNNGALDWVIGSPDAVQVLLSDADGALRAGPEVPGLRLFEVTALTPGDSPGLIGLAADGGALAYFAQGTLDYHWKRIRPRAARTLGDRRINTFAVGGEIELRSGMLYQKQPVSGQLVHFGLGENLLTEVARITWPNGDVQVEFDLLSDEAVLAEQRLKGSCPWLFTNTGSGLQFVTDFLWRSPLGLRINAQETAGLSTTEDWVLIPGTALAPVDGNYEVRITAELWESHFFDHVSLLVVDHPPGSRPQVDERFAFPPPPLDVQLLTLPKPFASVTGTAGEDVAPVVEHRDERYLADFELGAYQGIAVEHTVEMRLPADAGPAPVLVGHGWVRPTDSSINVAIGQGRTAPPSSLQLEIWDGAAWRVARSDLGFPSGKNKTILLDLEGLWPRGLERRVRLRTNLEIYWDQLAWAEASRDSMTVSRYPAASALLRYRGFSRVVQESPEAPETPVYGELEGTAPVWRDLVGYHTRFGDVTELLEKVDDRYVIMNAGDELVFRFPVPPGPSAGWTRDFVLVGDGWVKDGDLNTTYSTTVLPLPTHGAAAYNTPPNGLERDPAFLSHPSDWDLYHTRYVSPERFRRALAVPRGR
jgi:FG-GAP-like repeat/Tetratricopeptide repeat